MVWYERRRARQLNSDFLLADASHTRSDIYVTAAAFASLVLARRGYGAVDALLAIGVALLIAWNGYQIVRHTVPVLVDERGVDAGLLRRVVGDDSATSWTCAPYVRERSPPTCFSPR